MLLLLPLAAPIVELEAAALASNPPDDTTVAVDPFVDDAAAAEDTVPAVAAAAVVPPPGLALDRRSRPFLELPYPARSTMGGAAGRFTSLFRFLPNFFLLPPPPPPPPPVKEDPKGTDPDEEVPLLASAVEDNEVVPRMMQCSEED